MLTWGKVVVLNCSPTASYAAARMLEAMDHDVDRCQDFYSYACGTWNRVHVIPSDRPSYNTFQKMSDDLQAKLKGEGFSFKHLRGLFPYGLNLWKIIPRHHSQCPAKFDAKQ
jgi:Peptidase family M13